MLARLTMQLKYLRLFRHDAAHLLAQVSVCTHTQFAYGPATENGFIMTLIWDTKVNEDDFPYRS